MRSPEAPPGGFALKIRYIVTAEDLLTHHLHVAIEVSGAPKGPTLEMVMPVWTPGSYQIREFPRHVRRVSATTRSGASLPVTKVAKNRWSVATGGETDLTFAYSVYGHILEVEGVDLTDEHMFLNGAPALCYVEGALREPLEIVVNPPKDWKVYTELPEVTKAPPTFRADNFDELVDNPIDVGHPSELNIHVRSVPHRILFCGGGGNYAPHQVESDIGKIVEATYKLFGELPVKSYTFFYHLGEEWDGGLEHKFSTSIVMAHSTFRPKKSYESFLSVTCHEYFHLFNVKRIKSEVLGPFDYTRENYTRMLWAMEGITDYYTWLLLRRGGVITPKRYLEKQGDLLKRYREIPGRNAQSLEEASFDSWIDLYKPYEETRNASISYYLKGGLVGILMDLEIRAQTKNAKSFDDVMRYLWQNFGKTGKGIPEAAFQSEAEKATGANLAEIFERYIRGREEYDFPRFLAHAGLEVEAKETPEPEDGEPAEVPGYLGVEFKREGGRPRISVSLEGGPGRRAGLTPGDEILALNGSRVTYDDLADALKRFAPGETLDVTLFRRGRLTSLPVTLGRGPPTKVTIKPMAKPTDEQKAIAESWLETTWATLSPKSDASPKGG